MSSFHYSLKGINDCENDDKTNKEFCDCLSNLKSKFLTLFLTKDKGKNIRGCSETNWNKINFI